MELGMDTQIQNIPNFLIQNTFREAERRDLTAHHATSSGLFVIKMNFVTQRRQVARYGERCWAAADERYFFPVFREGAFGHQCFHVAFKICSNAFESANSNGFFLHAPTPTCGLAWPVAGAPEHPWEYVGFPIDHVSLRVSLGSNEAYIFGHRGVRRACVLAIHHFVEVLRVFNIGWLHGNKILWPPM